MTLAAALFLLASCAEDISAQRRATFQVEPIVEHGHPPTSYILPALGGTLLGGAAGGLVGIFALEDDPAITFSAAIAGVVLGSGIAIARTADSPRVGILASLAGLAIGLAASAAVHDLDDVANGAPLVAIPIGFLVGSVITAGLVD